MLVERRTTDVFRSLRRRNKRINRHQVAAVMNELRRGKKPIKKKNRPKLIAIFIACCDVFDLELESKSRKQNYIYARYIYMNKALGYGYTLDSIGKLIDRHHSTVMHGKHTYKDLENDSIFFHEYISKEVEIDNLIKGDDEGRAQNL